MDNQATKTTGSDARRQEEMRGERLRQARPRTTIDTTRAQRGSPPPRLSMNSSGSQPRMSVPGDTRVLASIGTNDLLQIGSPVSSPVDIDLLDENEPRSEQSYGSERRRSSGTPGTVAGISETSPRPSGRSMSWMAPTMSSPMTGQPMRAQQLPGEVPQDNTGAAGRRAMMDAQRRMAPLSRSVEGSSAKSSRESKDRRDCE